MAGRPTKGPEREIRFRGQTYRLVSLVPEVFAARQEADPTFSRSRFSQEIGGSRRVAAGYLKGETEPLIGNALVVAAVLECRVDELFRLDPVAEPRAARGPAVDETAPRAEAVTDGGRTAAHPPPA